MNFQEYIQRLKFVLDAGLPGEEAQHIMAPAGRKPIRDYLASQTNPRLSGVALLLYPKENQIYSFLTLRPSYDGVHGGQVSLPGGKQDASDASLEATALRELFEETGIAPGSVSILGALTPLYIPVSNALVHPYLVVCPQEPVFNPRPGEVEEIIEFPVEILNNPEIIKRKPIRFRNRNTLLTACYEINGHTVWGATAMILKEFEMIAGKTVTSS